MSVTLALVLGAVPAAADTPVAHSGRYGAHYLSDSEEYPGATCRYDGRSNLSAIRVRAPFIFARNTTAAIDSGRVGWRMLVQELEDESTTWLTVTRSTGVEIASARDDRAADFAPIEIAVDSDPASAYRVIVRMYWYGGAASGHPLIGRATHLVDWYRWSIAPSHPGSCPGAIL